MSPIGDSPAARNPCMQMYVIIDRSMRLYVGERFGYGSL
jgi:hypothetical protein